MRWLLVLLLTATALAQQPLLGSWYVAPVENGEVGRWDGKPWVFFEEGRLSCDPVFTGKWHQKAERTYTVQIISGNGQTDIFELVLDSNRWFTCVKNGQTYRLGRR